MSTGRRCTTTSRPPRWRSPTVRSTSATRRYVDVPLHELLSDRFAAERACKISQTKALTPPVAGRRRHYDGNCGNAGRTGHQGP